MEFLAQASVFVLPSYTEGFPNAVLEAMALGKPIIGTRVGAIPEMLTGDCGVLIAPKNAREIRDALKLLLNDNELRKRLAGKARARVTEEYSLESVFHRYKQVWYEAARLSRDSVRLAARNEVPV
jgi:glycosyltransferase involved in cell wall biosynthesis